MKIHSVELRNVRQIRKLCLDLSAPLTVVGGPNGVGKTTLQQAILAAMFISDKATRDSFVSQFDPDSSPTVVLGLSHGGPAPTIRLTRNLLDDKGEWQEGDTVLKKKKQALDKIQEMLPISADAAALLLWGRQDDLPAVVESFPSDGHSLLTAATIKGSGPDPKEIIGDLVRDFDNARKGERGGQVVGPLVQARATVKQLEDELQKAAQADEDLRQRREQLQQAKVERDERQNQAAAAQTQLDKLAELERLLTQALEQLAIRDQMVTAESEWEDLEGEIDKAGKDLVELQRELELLTAQHRVARDQELAGQIEALTKRLEHAEELDSAAALLAKDLKAVKRPDAADVAALEAMQVRIKETSARMEATGVRYQVSAERGPRTLRLAEDGGPEQEITLPTGASRSGIVGRLTIEVDGLRFAADGKEDIAGLKNAVLKTEQDIVALLKTFETADSAAFANSAKEKQRLQQAWDKKKNELRVQLGNASIAGLKTDLERLTAARSANNVTLSDQETCAGKLLASAAEIDKGCAKKRGEIGQARDALRVLQDRRPSEAEKNLHRKNLDVVRAKAREAAAAFTGVDELRREPTKDLQAQIGRDLDSKRRAHAKLTSALLEAEKRASDLGGQLKTAQPHRPLGAIAAELDEAREALDREETLQEARVLLRQRIETKMETLAAHVPVDLGNKVTQHLARLTGGVMGRVVLGQELAVTHVGENGAARLWQPGQLSHGERHQAALAVKIAVARALAETSGPVFIVLDDSLVSFDPRRRAATENFLLDLVKDGKLQVIVLTCHTDWAGDWSSRSPGQVRYVELTPTLDSYYRVRS